MHWAVYARYSSDLQAKTSIDDQVALCREWVTRQGGIITAIYADPELSGAHAASRPEFQRLRRDAAQGRFHGVVAEALDRFARNLSDTDQLRTHMEHHGIRLATVAEGDITLLHVGLNA